LSEELAAVLTEFLSEYGVWFKFEEFVEEQGYYVIDFGLEKDD